MSQDTDHPSTTIKVIVGSIRRKRFSEKPAAWIQSKLTSLIAERHLSNVRFDVLDLRDYDLPFMCEETVPAYGRYEDERTKRWAAQIAEGDGFIVITPEYNHGYPGVLKNALDIIYPEWSRKPVGFVSYGSAGGARVIEQLRQVVIELDMIPLTRAINLMSATYKAIQEANISDDNFIDLFDPMQSRLDAFLCELLFLCKLSKTYRTMTI